MGVAKVMPWHGAYSWMVYALAVHPDHRRQGVGRTLLDACIGFARRRGAKTIRSECHVENAESQAFHEAVGFSYDGWFVAEDGDRKMAFSMNDCEGLSLSPAPYVRGARHDEPGSRG